MCDDPSMRNKDDAEDYNFFATLRMPNETVRRVLCRLWRPRRMTDRIRMVFYPTERQASQIEPSRFSVEGRITGLPGNAIKIRASEVWADSIPSRSLGKRRYETVFEADPIDLQIMEAARPGNKKEGVLKAYINYVVTPDPRELSPASMFTYMGDGAVRVRTARRFSFTLRGRRRLDFAKRYRHERRGDEEVTWSELVAKEQRTLTRAEFSRVDERHLDELDDFLLLVSFAARYRVVCVGIDAYTEAGDHFTFYRKNMTVPEPVKQDLNDAVVDVSDFGRFIRKAYRRFIASGDGEPHELVRDALYLVMPHEDRTIESEFTTLYAALETLVLWHRRAVGMELIIQDNKEWSEVRAALARCVKEHPLLKSNKEKRKLLYDKLGELRRVPFSAAFDSFCSYYDVDVTDLWPVTGKAAEMPLSEIRNHIVHGSALKRSQLLALGRAGDHLRWTVERMLLAVLGWPVAESKVRPAWLAKNRSAMIELGESRRAMQGLPSLPPG